MDAAPPRIWGVRLQPLSLGHSLLLDALGVDVDLLRASRGAVATPDQLGLAVWVCSMPWRTAHARLHGWSARRLRRALTRLGRRMARAGGRQAPAGQGRVRAGFVQGLDGFVQYLDGYLANPERFTDGKGIAHRRGPWPLLVAAALGKGAAEPTERALDLPAGWALCLLSAGRIVEGDESYFSDLDYSLRSEAESRAAGRPATEEAESRAAGRPATEEAEARHA
jgi:hypothetical protein